MTDRDYRLTAQAAADRYQRDQRFAAMANSIAHDIMRDYVDQHPRGEYSEVARVVDQAVRVTIETIFYEDTELKAQRALADRYRKIAEDALATKNRPPPIIVRGP